MNIVICYMVPSVVAVICAAVLALREPHLLPIHRQMSGILAVLFIPYPNIQIVQLNGDINPEMFNIFFY